MADLALMLLICATVLQQPEVHLSSRVVVWQRKLPGEATG
jgi:hypothetical protein